MAMQTKQQRGLAGKQSGALGGVPVRTDVHAGLSWDELDDQVASLWQQLSGAASNVVNNLTGAADSTTTTAA